MKLIHKDLNKLADFLADSDYDFYAFAITKWHLINIESYIADIAVDRNLKGIIVIAKHVKSGYVINASDVVQIHNVSIEVYNQDELNNKLIEINKINRIKSNKALYIIAPLNYQFELGRCIQKRGRKNIYLVRTDEGLVEYYDDGFKVKVSKNERPIKRPFIKELIDNIILISSKKGWNKNNIIDRYLMSRNIDGKLVPQEQVVASVRSYINHSSNIIHHEDEPYALFLSFVWEENNMWDMDEYKGILKMLRKVLADNGVKLYVKPHPRENLLNKYEKWGIPIFASGNVALEILLANLNIKPIILFGLDSTALINASMIGGSVSVSLKNFVSKEKTTEIMWEGLESFEKYFCGYVKFVDSEEEIKKIVYSIKRDLY